jgi:RNA-binding protein
MKKIDKQGLKARAHHLNPVIIIGSKGLTSAVLDETNIALDAHELIKVKINGADKEEKLNIATSLSESLGAEFIQLIGNIAIFYREREDN